MKKEYVIRISEKDYEQCRSSVLADLPKEGAAFLLTGRKIAGNSEELIVRRVVEIPRSEYRIRENYHLDLSPKAINGLISLCEQNRLGVILCHSHSTNSPYSHSDNEGERRLAKAIWENIPDVPVGSLLMSPEKVRARIWKPSGEVKPVSSLKILGRYIQTIYLNCDTFNCESDYKIYDRQILAFGKKGQSIIANTKVGIVGVGGTGSSVAEQLVRIGVSNIILIDPDVLEPSNISRIYGSTYEDAYPHWYRITRWWKKKIPKVEVITNHLKKINPDIRILAIQDSVVKEHVVKALLDRDIIFSCTDEHWGRSVLNQLSYQYFIPLINMGVQIDAKEDKIRGASGSVHILMPDKPCLWCYEFLNAGRIGAEALPKQERESLLREGYVQNIDTDAPSVISLTTTVASHAVTAFLQLTTDFMGPAGDISCLKYYIMEGTISRGKTDIKEHCICRKVRGYGDFGRLLTI